MANRAFTLRWTPGCVFPRGDGMRIESLELEEFRAYRRLRLEVAAPGLALHGENGSGKSTLLEAIAMLATTRSPRTSFEREVVNWASGAEFGFPPFARVAGTVISGGERRLIEISLVLEREGATTVKKQVRLDGRAVRASTAVGILRTVLFTPEDVGLITGSPGDRRRYLDVMLCQLDRAYLRALAEHGKVLSQRNSLVKQFGRDGVSPQSRAAIEQLGFWDQRLVAAGAALVARRATAVAALDRFARESFGRLDGGALAIRYAPALDAWERLAGIEASDAELGALVAQAMHDELERRRGEEFRRGATVVGPHRDEVVFTLDGRSLASFGSRGQQRLGVLAAKLAEVALMARDGGEPPVLLLDDVLSELDARHRGLLLETAASGGCQVLITATDAALLDDPHLADLPAARIDPGAVTALPIP